MSSSLLQFKSFMKSIVRNIAFYALSLFALTQLLAGVKISGGLTIYVIGGAILSIMFLVVKPILSIVTLPLNVITLGTFSFLINAIILYLLTIVVPNISIKGFEFSGFSFAGFIVPKLFLNTFFAFIISSFLLSIFVSFLTWLTKR